MLQLDHGLGLFWGSSNSLCPACGHKVRQVLHLFLCLHHQARATSSRLNSQPLDRNVLTRFTFELGRLSRTTSDQRVRSFPHRFSSILTQSSYNGDLTGKIEGKGSYPTAYGGYCDVWKCSWMKKSGPVEVFMNRDAECVIH